MFMGRNTGRVPISALSTAPRFSFIPRAGSDCEEVSRGCGSQRQIPAAHCDGNYRRRKVLPRGRLSPEVFAKARSRFLAFLIDLPGVRGEPASPRSSRVKESLELAHKPGEWERLSLTNQRAPGALGRPKCDSLPVVSRAGIRELRRAQFSAATAFAVTGCGSANCSQKPIISSSLGSPQRTALDGSGFKGLLLELSK